MSTPRSLGTFLRRLAAVAGSSVLSQGLTGIVYIFAARGLGPGEFGEAAVVVAISTISVVIFDAGLMSLIVRDVAEDRVSTSDARRIIHKKRLFAPVWVLIVSTISYCLLRQAFWTALFGLYAYASWEAQVANGLLRSQEKFAPIVRAQILSRILSLIGALGVSLSAAWSPVTFAFCLLLAPGIESLQNHLNFRRLIGRHEPSHGRRSLFAHQKASIPYGFTSMSNVAQQLDTPIVAAATGVYQAGLYAAAGRLIGPLGFLANALSAVASPWLARCQSVQTLRDSEEKRVLRITLWLSIGPLIAGAIGPFLLPLLLGSEYSNSGATFAVLAVGVSITTYVQGYTIVIQARRKQAQVAIAVAVGLAIGLVATFVLAQSGGAVGAAWGLAVSQSVILGLLFRTFRKIRSNPPTSSTATLRNGSELVGQKRAGEAGRET